METKKRSIRYCVFCGSENDAEQKTCAACGKELYPQENLLEEYLRKEAEEQIKGKIVDTVFDKLKKFLLSHLYGIVLTVSVVFTAAAAVGAVGGSGIPRDAVPLEQPPAADALGHLVSEAEEEEPALPEPSPTEDPSAGTEAADPQAIYAAYLALLPNARGAFPGYYIYDIDKDGIPELLLTAEDGPNQGVEVFSYAEGQAYSAGVLWGFSNGVPIPASYPDGNGIVLTEIARDYECIWVISLEDGRMTGDVRTAANSVYEEPLYDPVSAYYRNAKEDLGGSVGHPYRAETEAPFFDGSQLLGLNSVSDDTALREALGI